MIANLWMGFDDRAQVSARETDANGDLIKSPGNALGHKITPGLYRKDNPVGPRDYELWSLYYEVSDGTELLQIRNDLNAEFPGELRTIAAWWWDGTQVMNPAGTQPQFPLHASILEYMPDVDDVGTRPTIPSDVNLGLGQAERIF